MQPDCVADSPQALARLRAAHEAADPYALVIVDYQMPEMNGLMLACAIRADATFSQLPLIMLSSIGHRLNEEDLQRAGIAAFVTKPVRPSQLYDCITATLDASSAPRYYAPKPDRSLGVAQMRIYAKVLIAEDNTVNQKVTARMLEKLGCRVDIVANGLEAVEAVTRLAYDCIFMDRQMPEMDGYEATRAIRQYQESADRHTPIIAMTANAMQGDREQCLAAGMDDYVSKPVGANDLLSVLQKWVQPVTSEPLPCVFTATISPVSAGQYPSSALGAEAFAALCDLCGDEDPSAIIEIIDLFVENAAGKLTALHRAATADDAIAVEQVAHTLKSSAVHVGALRMSALCHTLQELGRAGKGRAALPVIEQLSREFDRVSEALEHECRKLGA